MFASKLLRKRTEPDPTSRTRFAIMLSVFIFLCVGFFLLTSVPRNLRFGDADNGVLDLRGQEFADNVYTLSGEWEFYYGKYLGPEDFAASRASGALASEPSEAEVPYGTSAATPRLDYDGIFVKVPNSWETTGYPLYGYATYRLTLLTEDVLDLSFYFSELPDSSIIYIDGRKVAELGHPGTTKDDTVTGVRNFFVQIRPEIGGQTEIIVQVANFGWFVSGMSYYPMVGSPDAIMGDFVGRRVMLGLAIGVLITMSIYQTSLFSLRLKKVYLAFALTCLTAALHFLTSTNSLVTMIPTSVIDTPIRTVFYASVIAQAASLTFFTYEVFLLKVRKTTLAIYAVLFCVPYLVYLLLPYGTMNVRVVLLFCLVPMGAAFIKAVRLERVRKDRNCRLFLGALAIMIVWDPAQTILFGNHFFVSGMIPTLFLLFCQGMVVIINYAEIERNRKELHAQNDFYCRMAHDLMTPITKVSTNIQIANLQSATDHERLARSQEEIMGMKTLLDLALSEDRKKGLDELDDSPKPGKLTAWFKGRKAKPTGTGTEDGPTDCAEAAKGPEAAMTPLRGAADADASPSQAADAGASPSQAADAGASASQAADAD
jgi:signal transduction histidine kinase